MINRFLIALTMLLLTHTSYASGKIQPIEYVLDNGLKVLIMPDHRSPTLVTMVWYKVGSSYELPGATGLSHLLEHMMFKGTKTLAPGAFSQKIAAAGGSENAFTSLDFTAYFQQLPKDQLALSFQLEADRMANLEFTDADFLPERAVVENERRDRTDNNPQGILIEQFNAAAYATSPYRHPVIGWMPDLAKLTRHQLEQWYRNWYAPNNATLVVVGDVNPAEVKLLAEQTFGVLPSRPVPTLKAPEFEMPQVGEKRITVRVPAQIPTVMLGYKVPSLHSAQEKRDSYALTLLAGILDAGSSSRINQSLIQGQQIAAQADANYNAASRLDTLFTLSGIASGDHRIEVLESALRDQIKQLRDKPVTAEELKRVMAQVTAADIYQRDSNFYQAMQLGIAETVGYGWQRDADFIEQLRLVTPEHIQDVAKRYLIDEQLTVATLVPLPLATPNAEVPASTLNETHTNERIH